MSKYDYNVAVIGAGSAGLVSAYTANLLGAKTALISSGDFGGDCLHTGCIPSKSLIHIAKKFKNIKELGLSTDSADPMAAFNHIKSTIERIEPHDSPERYKKLGIDTFKEKAELIDGHTVKMDDSTITARRIIIATGSEPRVPTNAPSEYLTSDTIWSIEKIPQKLTIIGGGPIGCEIGQSFQRLGSQVIIVERGKRLLPKDDPQASEIIQDILEEEGVTVLLNADVENYADSSISIEAKNYEHDKLLFAIGRRPATSWVDDTSIELNRGYISVNNKLRTSMKSVYACGDVTGGLQFTHTANSQAQVAGSNAALDYLFARKYNPSAVPWTTFTDPGVGHIGSTPYNNPESLSIESHVVPLSELDRALTDQAQGFVKLHIHKGAIVGANVVSPHAAELIGVVAYAITNKLDISSFYNVIFPYPSFDQVWQQAASSFRDKHKPRRVLGVLKKLQQIIR